MPASIAMLARAVLLQREGVPNVPEVLTDADGIKDIREFGFIEPDFKRIEANNAAKRTFGPSPAQFDAAAATVGLKLGVPVRRPAAGGSVPPDIAELLIACGLTETINVGASVVYSATTPSDLNAAPSATLEVYEAGKKYTLAGTRGDFTLSGKPGSPVMLQADLKAKWSLPAANVSVPAVAAPTGLPLVFSGALAITEDGAAIDVGSFEFSLGNQVEEDVSSSGLRIIILNRTPVLKINPLAVATVAEWDKLTSGTVAAFVADFNGMKLNIGKAQLVEQGSEERAGRLVRSRTWECLETTGDDMFTLTFD